MRYYPYFFFGIFVLAGVAIAAYGLAVLHRARRSAGWPRADGVITRSEVVLDREGHYAPAVVYSYTVAGAQYRGTDIGWVRASSSDGGYARACAARYQVGVPVVVCYDPEGPTAAVLEPGLSKKSFLPLVFGLGFAAFGGWFCLLWWLFDS